MEACNIRSTDTISLAKTVLSLSVLQIKRFTATIDPEPERQIPKYLHDWLKSGTADSDRIMSTLKKLKPGILKQQSSRQVHHGKLNSTFAADCIPGKFRQQIF